MTDETTTEQLAEIEGQTEPTRATGYTPPEGWRVLQVGERLLPGDQWVNWEGTVSRPDIQHGDGATVSGGRYIRWVKPQPQLEPHAAAIEELRSEVSYVQNLLGESRQQVTQLDELVVSLRTINDAQGKTVEAAGKQNDALRVQVRILQQEASKKASRIEFLETLNAGNGAAIGDYKAKVEKLQGLVDTARGQLETAATEHDSLSTQLAAVKAELVTQAETSRRLQIELDAAQQVPADSPELRQLRADLEQVTLGRDTYRDGYNRVLSDLETVRETTKAETVEAIVEWLVPVQAAIAAPDNVDESTRAGWFAEEVIQHLPSIMRSLTGLDSPDHVD